ncbi:cation:proton antiporter [Methanosarcina sp. DH2]|uniref:cation:proton antiporter domain-containing protein n=1 Tax=Methanosarcina sp. DH2 TaxID=2605639 RepID=UPI002107204B|nr:cation:proton antiporter [Methanosarcina sp. DH2]
MLTYWITGFGFTVSLLIGAIVTPTDPILTLSVVSGKLAEKNLPGRLRHFLLTEAGSNEGLAYLFVVLPILLMTLRPAEALNRWTVHTLLWEMGFSIVLGSVAGYISGRMLRIAESKGTIDASSYYSYCLALTLLVLGGVKLLKGEGILAVFVAGTIFSMVSTEKERHEEEHVVEGVDRFFMVPIFTLLGLVLPWQEWAKLGWEGLLLAFLILLLHRLPILLFTKSFIPDIRNNRDMLFAGWFGPVGIGAFYYSQVSMRQTGIMEIWPVVSLIVCMSIVLHGITETPFAKLYRKLSPEKSEQNHEKSENHKPEPQKKEYLHITNFGKKF